MSSSPASAVAIDTTGLAKQYGATTALAGLTMQVPAGHVFGFLGPNGAGKTTAVKLLLGLARPTSGAGTVLGAPLGDRETRRRIGYLPELFRYQAWLTARDVLGLHASLAGLPHRERGHAIGDALGLVGLLDRGGDRVGTFSKGMQQRLGLGVALLGRPDLVFLDEPTSALDPIGRQDVRAVIRELRDRGTAVFLNSHLLTEVERVCDEVAIVDHGRVVAAGTLDELLGAATVRVRVTDLSADARASLAPFGTLSDDPPWLVVRGCPPERVPDLVAAIVAAGGRIHAVDAGRETLEERFLELLGHAPDPDGGPAA
jgi:ABC-2 type transport system ATP-binding protein